MARSRTLNPTPQPQPLNPTPQPQPLNPTPQSLNPKQHTRLPSARDGTPGPAHVDESLRPQGRRVGNRRRPLHYDLRVMRVIYDLRVMRVIMICG